MYKKAVLINISETALDQPFWKQLDAAVETKVLLRRDDPNLLAELADCDCLLRSRTLATKPARTDSVRLSTILKHHSKVLYETG